VVKRRKKRRGSSGISVGKKTVLVGWARPLKSICFARALASQEKGFFQKERIRKKKKEGGGKEIEKRGGRREKGGGD